METLFQGLNPKVEDNPNYISLQLWKTCLYIYINEKLTVNWNVIHVNNANIYSQDDTITINNIIWLIISQNSGEVAIGIKGMSSLYDIFY